MFLTSKIGVIAYILHGCSIIKNIKALNRFFFLNLLVTQHLRQVSFYCPGYTGHRSISGLILKWLLQMNRHFFN